MSDLNRLSFDTDKFRAAALFVSSEETRYYMNGVHVQPVPDAAGGGVILTATDGHRIASIYDADGRATRKIILSCRFNSPELKTGKRETLRRAFLSGNLETGYNGIIRDCAGDSPDNRPEDFPQTGTLFFDEIDGSFPEWEKVFPSVIPFSVEVPAGAEEGDALPVEAPLCFNYVYMKSFTDAGRILSPLDKGMSIFHSTELSCPVQIRFAGCPDAAFGLMQLRQAPDLKVFPDWLLSTKTSQHELETKRAEKKERDRIQRERENETPDPNAEHAPT